MQIWYSGRRRGKLLKASDFDYFRNQIDDLKYLEYENMKLKEIKLRVQLLLSEITRLEMIDEFRN